MSTDGRERMESIWSSIQNWMYNTNWTDPDAADRVTQAVNDQGVDKFIDPLPGVPFNEAASGNYASIKEEFGLETERDREVARADFEDRQKAAAQDEVEDQFREYGIQAVADAFENRAGPELQERFDDVFREFGPDFYRTIAFNEIGTVVDEFDLDAELVSRDRLEALQNQTGRPESTAEQLRQAERQVLDRLENAFGQRFDDVDDAIASLRDRIDNLQQLDVRTGEVRIKGRRGGPPAIVTEVGFGAFEDATKQQASQAIDAGEVDVRRTYDKRIGSVRVAGDELQLIDLTPALELPEVAGAVVAPGELVRRFEIEPDVAAPPAPEVTDPDLPDTDDEDDDEPRADPDDVFDAPDRQGSLIPDAEEEAADDGAAESDGPADQPDEEPDSADETPTPDVSETGVDSETAELIDVALDAVEDGGIDEVGAALTTDELFRLAAAANRDEQVEDLLDPVFEAFQSASADERSAAAARHDGLAELQRSLLGVAPGEMRDPGDVEIEFEDDAESIDDLIDEAEPGRRDDDDDRRGGPPGRQGEITDPSEDPEQGPLDPNDLRGGGNSGVIGGSGGVRAQPGSNRPDPNQQDADKKLATLLSNRLMKAQAWIAAEQERLSRGPENIEQFWETRGKQIWGSTLTKREFTDLTTDGLV